MAPVRQSASSAKARVIDLWTRFVHIYHREIWQSAFLQERSLRGYCYAILRVVSITITAFFESRIATRAAALSFSSLLGLGPLLVIAVLVAGFALGPGEAADNNATKAAAKSDAPAKERDSPRVDAGGAATPATDLARSEATERGSEKKTRGSRAAREKAGRAAVDAADPAAPGAAPASAPAGGSRKKLVADTLNRMIKIIAPQIAQYEEDTQTENQANPQLVNIIDDIISKSRSGSAGAAGIFSLLFIVLVLFKSVEDTFNDIWGVRQGRSVLMRVVLYWTILTLGALMFFTAVAMLSASTFFSVFFEKTASSGTLMSLGFVVQLFSFALLSAMLTLFYRVIPNTRVFWRAAFLGGLVVAALLLGNNFLQFLYVKRVFMERSLYGSLAIVPVLMFGLYVFWLFVLIGGVVSYALQNVHFRNSQVAWSALTEAMRERMTLVVFLTICRRFRDCLPPISVSHLSEMLKVPSQLLNECLNRLVKLQLVTTLRPPPESTATDYLYQPARPLNRITLFDFKTLDDNLGEDPVGRSLEHIDPLVCQYEAALNQLGEQAFFQKTVEELFNDHPFEESRPPFATDQRQPGK